MNYQDIASRGDIPALLDPHFDDINHRKEIMRLDMNGRIRNNLVFSQGYPLGKRIDFLLYCPSLRHRIQSFRQLLKQGLALEPHTVLSYENTLYQALWLYRKMPEVPYLREKALSTLYDYARQNEEHAFLIAELDVDLPWFKDCLGMHYRRWYEIQMEQNVLKIAPVEWKEHMYHAFTTLLGSTKPLEESPLIF